MHYNNPKIMSGRIDSSGIRFYYTTELRRYDAGCLELGLEYTPKMAIPPSMEAFQLSGHCTVSCTEIVSSEVKSGITEYSFILYFPGISCLLCLQVIYLFHAGFS